MDFMCNQCSLAADGNSFPKMKWGNQIRQQGAPGRQASGEEQRRGAVLAPASPHAAQEAQEHYFLFIYFKASKIWALITLGSKQLSRALK